MTAQLIDGNALAQADPRQRRRRAWRPSQRAACRPGLAVILVGENPASQVYVRNKVKDCNDVGVHSVLETYDASMTEADLLARVRALNADPAIHGILVQLPLPPHIDAHKVIETISPSKDVDGFHVASAGALMIGRPGFKACTPYGCMKLLESIGCNPRGKHAVVIGRSNIVGKPMAMLLLQANATVTVCHSATPDLAHHTRQADIVVAAVGKRNTLTADMVKPGRRGHRRGHEPQRRRQAVRRRRLRRRTRGGRLDHAGARRRRPDDPGHAAGQHRRGCRTRRPTRQTTAHETEAIMQNPLLDIRDLPAFADIRPEHVGPAIDALLGERERRARKGNERRGACRLRRDVGGARRRDRAARPRLGRGRPPERRGRHARVARRVHREPAEGDRVPHAPRRRRAAVREVQGDCREPEGRDVERAPHNGAVQRDARLRAVRCRTARRREGALRADPGALGRAGAEVLRARARCDRQLCVLRERRGARRRA